MPVYIDTSSTMYYGGEMALDDSGNIYTIFQPSPSTTIFVACSTDGGNTWTKNAYEGSGIGRGPMDIAVDHRGNIWILWASTEDEFASTYINLSKSADSGRTFATVFRSVAYGGGYIHEKIAADVQNNIHILWDDAHFKLTTFFDGDTARRVDANVPTGGLGINPELVMRVSNDQVVHCAWGGYSYDSLGFHSLVYYSRSNDRGMTFGTNTFVDTGGFPCVAVDTTGRIVMSYDNPRQPNSNLNVVRSINGGLLFDSPTLLPESDSSGYGSILCVDSAGGINLVWPRVVAGRVEHLHYRSSDGGVTFDSYASFPDFLVFINFVAGRNGYIYASGYTRAGFCVSKTNVILSVSGKPEKPNKFALWPNYPNPFNPSTTLQFSLGSSGIADMRVFDIVGREVAVLLSKYLAPGTYSVTWDASGFSSGIYFVRLVAGGNEISIRKMLLMR